MHYLATPFRLFFLGAGLFAMLIIPLWVLILSGHWNFPRHLDPITWHAHEMLFGYAGAVLSGFLLTATVHWTGGNKTVGPLGFALLFCLWMLARATHVFQFSFPGSHWLGLLFFVGTAIAIGQAIVRAKRWRNIGFPLLLLVMAGSDLALHLASKGSIGHEWNQRPLWLAVDSIALIILIFGGRIIPLFTKNALSLPSSRKKSALDYAAIATILLLMAGHGLGVNRTVESTLWGLSGLLTIARLYGWGGSKAFKSPLLLILHLGWLLTGLGMLLIALALMLPTLLPFSSALHLLFIGGFGTLTLGMMARVTLGHTGRKKTAGTSMRIAFTSLILASIVRITAPMVSQAHYIHLLWLAALLWSLSFVIFVWVYLPILLSPRADGKTG